MTDIIEYNNSPTNPDILTKLASYYYDTNMHDLALLFAEKCLTLNIDDKTRNKLLEIISVSSFYSKDNSKKSLGAFACEEISNNRSIPWSTRSQTRINNTYYIKGLSEIMPSAEITECSFITPNGYLSMNPSIYNYNGELWMIQRTVNYKIRENGSYDMQGDTAIRTVNYLLRLDNNLNILSAEEIKLPANKPEPLYKDVLGFEDSRLFFWKGEPWCTSTVREMNTEGYCEIVLARISNVGTGNCMLDDYKVIIPKFTEKQNEKNWMPYVNGDTLYFVYSCDPVRIIDENGNLCISSVTHVASDSYRGGGSLIELEDGLLGIIHESHYMPNYTRRYTHRFIFLDRLGRLSKITKPFYLKTLGIEFAAGLARHPTDNSVLISFGLHDKASYIAKVSINDIKKELNAAGLPRLLMPDSHASDQWINSQINTALKDHASVDLAKKYLTCSTLPLHTDNPKNWDNLIAVWTAVNNIEQNENIMDIGATHESAFLPSLKKFGYNNLLSINLDQKTTEVIDGVTYQYGDCTQTSFPDKHFGFITCLSVVEHGVDIEKFMQESARLLKDNGLLLISTDYWHKPVDTFNQTAFGAPVKVFDPNSINDLVSIARKYRLMLTTMPDLTCKDTVVNWIGMDYTFINLLFQKQ